jgi:methionine-S-sulfoxide reductase
MRYFIPALLLVVILVFIFSISSKKNMFKKQTSKSEAMAEYQKLEEMANLKKATVSGGCFWCMEGPFEQLEGVEAVLAGYSGGDVENPTYEEVVTGITGHREAVQIYYDPQKIDFGKILETYWWQIDPTDSGGQFADRGEQYTTAIFYHDEKQKTIAEDAIKKLESSQKYKGSIATKILPFKNFFPAEDYHQDFYKHSKERYQRYVNLSGRKNYIEKNSKQ